MLFVGSLQGIAIESSLEVDAGSLLQQNVLQHYDSHLMVPMLA